MKKYIFISVILSVTVLIAMPYLVGVVAQKETDAAVVSLNEKLDDNGYFEVVAYKRTYRATESTFKLSVADFFETDVEIEFSCKGTHGLISYKYDCLVDDSSENFQKTIDEHFDGKEFVTLDGEIILFGALKQHLVIDSFNKSTDKRTVVFDGGEINFETTRDLNTLKVVAKLGSFKLSYEDNKTSFNSIDVNGYFYDAGDTLDFGKIEIGVSDFNYFEKELSTLSAAKLQLDSSLNGRGDAVEFNFDLKVEQAFALDGDDKQHEVDNLSIAFKVREINRKALVKLNKLIKTISTANEDPEDLAIGPMLTVFPTVESFLTQGFGFSMSVDATENSDRLFIAIDLNLNDKLSFLELSTVIYAPESILDQVNFTSDMILPDTFVDLDAEFAKYITDSSFYEKTGDGYKSKFSIKDGNVNINGKRMSAEKFVEEVMSEATQ